MQMQYYERVAKMNKRWSLWQRLYRERIRQIHFRPIQLVITFLVLLILFNLLGSGNPMAPAKHIQARVFIALAANTGTFFHPHLPSTHFTPLSAPLYGGNALLPEIALTFDDGPHPGSTLKIVAILKRFGIKATFFCVGQHIQQYPDYVRQEYANGNLVEDHTWTHPDLQLLSSAEVGRQLGQTANEIEQVTGAMPTLFRPPYGIFNWSIFAQARHMALSSIIWNVDPQDWSMPGTNAIIARVLGVSGNGSIILMHDGGGDRSQTVAALPTIITTLRQRGFRFVTVEQMIRHLGQKASGRRATTGQSAQAPLYSRQTPCLWPKALLELKPNWQADVTRRKISNK
jgi:peptidoglycan/xylan/chitin deacetylase (PgdA/CDA1 family)